MGTADLVAELKYLTNPERLAVIEAATRLIQDDLLATAKTALRVEQDQRLRAAAEALKDLYTPGGELTEWTALDAEDIYDDTCPG
jgi:hypothetical protein